MVQFPYFKGNIQPKWWTGKMRRDCYKPKAANPWSRARDSFKAMNIIARGVCQGTRCCKWENNFHGLASACNPGRGGGAEELHGGLGNSCSSCKMGTFKNIWSILVFLDGEEWTCWKEERWWLMCLSSGLFDPIQCVWHQHYVAVWLLGRSGCCGSLSRWW